MSSDDLGFWLLIVPMGVIFWLMAAFIVIAIAKIGYDTFWGNL